MTRTLLIAVITIGFSWSAVAPLLAQRSSAGRSTTHRGTSSTNRGDATARKAQPAGTAADHPAGRGPHPAMPARGGQDIWPWPLAWWGITTVDVPTERRGLDDRQGDVPVRAAAPAPTIAAEPSVIRPMLAVQPGPSVPQSARGHLQLEVEPKNAQVYIDGFYVGTVADAGQTPGGLSVAAGWHRLQFRAPGFETPAINLTIEANRTLNYQGALKPIRP